MLENQLITDDEFFHWLSPVFCLIVVLMLSRICLLIRPISLFAGFVVNVNDSIIVRFLVRRCYVISE